MEGFEKEQEKAGCLEALRERIYELKKESLDPYFVEYLENLQSRVIQEKHTVDLLYDELERKYKFYLERMEKANQESQTEADTKPEGEMGAVSESGDGGVTEKQDIPKPQSQGVQRKKKKDSEFTFGIVAFSIVGVFFLLTAFFMLGANFLNTFALGMSLYAIAFIVVLFSEAVIRRHSVRLSQVLSILGISGFYVSAYVNAIIMENMNLIVTGGLIALIVILGISYDKLRRKKAWKMNQISAGTYYGFVLAVLSVYIFYDVDILCQLIIFSALVLITRVAAKNTVMYPLDAVVTTIAGLFALSEQDNIYGYGMLGILLISVLLVRYWHTYYQCMITLTVLIFLINNVESEIVFPLIVAVLWLFMILFNHLKAVRGNKISIYNRFVLAPLVIEFLILAIEGLEYKFLYFVLAFLGIGFIYFMFQERYCLPEKDRGIIMSVFLTYMALVTEFTYPITSSILLMVIGLVSIGAGFVYMDKRMRIYGLVLSLFVCFKITLFDLTGDEVFMRMILFFAAGVVALVISGIYIILEKKYMKD